MVAITTQWLTHKVHLRFWLTDELQSCDILDFYSVWKMIVENIHVIEKLVQVD